MLHYHFYAEKFFCLNYLYFQCIILFCFCLIKFNNNIAQYLNSFNYIHYLLNQVQDFEIDKSAFINFSFSSSVPTVNLKQFSHKGWVVLFLTTMPKSIN